jgi:hypothetical protein
MNWLKVKQGLNAIAIVLMLCMFVQIILLAPFLSGKSTIRIGDTATRPATSTETLVGYAIFIACVILGAEIALGYVRKSFALDAGKIKVSTRNAASAIGATRLARDVFTAPFLVLIGLIANLVLVVVLANQIQSRGVANLPIEFWGVLGVFVVYLLGRPFLALALRPFSRKFSLATVPSFSFDANSVTLDLKRKRGLPPAQRKFISAATVPCIVKIGFDELDEIRAFSYVEAQLFMNYEVGLDVRLGMQQGKDLWNYLNGELDRPAVYSHWGSVGTTILLRGPIVCYLVSVTNDNANELIAAFNAFKKIIIHRNA